MTASEKALDRRIKQHVIAKECVFFAVVQPGFEDVAADELREIGVADGMRIVEGGIEFTGRLDACYRLNVCSRTATRVMMRIAEFKASNFVKLRTHACGIPWELHIKNGRSIVFSITCHHSRLYHTGRIEEELRGAISERLALYGLVPVFPDAAGGGDIPQTVFIRFDNDRCHVSLDTSGEPLYRRGYKTHGVEAPLRETLAALILRAAHAERYGMIIDPMCGSGTFAIEAAMMMRRSLPGLHRDFAFMQWPSFRPAAFQYLVRSLSGGDAVSAPLPGTVVCSDIDDSALAAARENARQAGVQDAVLPEKRDFLREKIVIPPDVKALIALNPPYGRRLSSGDTGALYRRIGETIRGYAGCGYAIIVPALDLEKTMSLSYDRKILFMNGGIRVAVIVKNG